MEMVVEILSWILLLTGSTFSIIGGIGLFRMPGFYSRVHASGITDTMGAGAILLGLMLQAGLTTVTIKLFFILAFLFITSPTAAHALVNGDMTNGLKPRTQIQEGEE